MGKTVFYQASAIVIEYYENNKYSKERVKDIRHTLGIIAGLLESHGWEFSPGFMKSIESLGGWSYSQLCDMHHVSAMLLMADEKGTTIPKNIRFQCSRRKPIVVEFATTLSEYITYLEKLGRGKSTIHFEEWANRELLIYLESIGIRTFDGITVAHIHNYCCINLSAYSPSTRQATIYRIRHFIKRLILLGTIFNTSLFDALDGRGRIPEHVVTILTDTQRKKIMSLPEPTNMQEARNKAILLCCLVLGLRESDVHTLRFEEIDWNQEKISIIQKKTRVPLTLPLPKNVGNGNRHLYSAIPSGYTVPLCVSLTIRPIQTVKKGK